MKARLLLFLLAIFSISIASAQLRVQQDDNSVVFGLDDTTDGDIWDAEGEAPYLYLYIDSSEASNGVSSEPLGPWPGSLMNVLDVDLYKSGLQLSNFYPVGVTVYEIQFTFSDSMGNRNPMVGGFNATDHGYTPLTLSTLDFEENKTTFNIINGQLIVSQNEIVSVNIYNITGQLVKTFTQINLDANKSLNLNLSKNQLYLVRIESQNGIKVIKTIN